MVVPRVAFLRSAGCGAALLSLAACVDPTGGAGTAASLVPRRAVGDFSIEFADTGRALFVAAGREVTLRPAPGLCIAPESVDVGPASGFAMIGDCPAAARADGASMDLPPALPAIVTVSIAEEPMFSEGSPRGGALADLERFLRTPEGLATVGRSGAPGAVSILATREIGDALYVQVEDRDADAMPIFGERFWRAFLEINGRMVLVSLSGFRDGPLGEEEMLAHLAAQVGVLRQANGAAVPPAEAALAAGAEVGGASVIEVAAAPEAAPAAAPVAPTRPGDEEEALPDDLAGVAMGGETEGVGDVVALMPVASVTGTGAAHAPVVAPKAPPRP